MSIHSNHFYSIDGDYDNGWNLEDVEVITLINRWIPTLIPPQLSDHMGFQIIYRSDHLSRYIHALLVFWTDTQARGLYSRLWILYSLSLSFYPSLIGAFSLRTEKISMIIWLWGDVLRIFGRRADYLNREKLVTLFKHFRGILSLKKFLEAFLELLDPPVSPLSWEQDSEENESEEPLFSLSTPKYLPQFFLTLILS